ncbi:MAG: CcoQ/FixQ family Cbb3-type cytochrome c oxidase assembly chaperone [Candidatus Omnitrophica bacterium]|nr:CcoQ/FixQ family Cbb3-type cytochrome c oxidase assembly chaperone [Candidatus Omnitrophota bacterium]
MKELILAQYTLIPLNCAALLIFLAIFAGSVLWVYRRSGRSYYKYMESLPLKDEE